MKERAKSKMEEAQRLTGYSAPRDFPPELADVRNMFVFVCVCVLGFNVCVCEVCSNTCFSGGHRCSPPCQTHWKKWRSEYQRTRLKLTCVLNQERIARRYTPTHALRALYHHVLYCCLLQVISSYERREKEIEGLMEMISREDGQLQNHGYLVVEKKTRSNQWITNFVRHLL